MAATWPGAVSTAANLYTTVNLLQTTLSGTINSAVTTIALTSTSGFPTAGAVTIDNEVIFYTNISGGNLTGCTRGSDGTTAASHNSGVPVGATVVAYHVNSLNAEVIAIETDLHTRFGFGSSAVAMPVPVSITGGNTFVVNTSDLSVDATNHRLGIGVAAPIKVLDVRGATNGLLLLCPTDDVSPTTDIFQITNAALSNTFNISKAGAFTARASSTQTVASGESKFTIEATAVSQSATLQLRANNATAGQCTIYMGDAGGATKGEINYDPSNNILSLYTNSTERLRLDASGNVAMASTKKFYLDGVAASGDTYISESSANDIVITTGGSSAMDISNTQVSIEPGRQFIIPSTKKLLLDGSGAGDTYLLESSANVMDFYAGGGQQFRVADSACTVIDTGSGLIWTRSTYDTYSWQQSGSGFNLRNTTDGRTEIQCDQAGGVSFGNTKLQIGGNQSYPVLQVVQATTATAVTTSSSSMVDTNLTVTITPKFNTSKILVMAMGSIEISSSTVNNQAIAQLTRNTATLLVAQPTTIISQVGGVNNLGQVSIVYYDSPATTSATIYKVQVSRQITGGSASVVFPAAGDAVIIVLEIAQ